MNNRLIGIVGAALLLSLQVIAAPALAADAITLKVALTDISSAMGMGPAGGGYGMLGHGMMGRGMMGYGMMGPGMMGGMMAVRTDHSSVKTGTIHFDVTNWSQGVLHELIIVAVDNPQATLPYDYSKAKVAEDQVKVLGDTGDLQPGASYGFDLALAPGTYLLFCNVPGHYAAGMVTPLTVTPGG
jgi:uncharacterized cupredoxin-like copper-binding protein